MHHILFIALGGAFGAVGRYWLSNHVNTLWTGLWPLGTLLVNASGSLFIGVLFVLLERAVLQPEWRSVMMVGFLGAFTTYSTYSLETVQLWEQGHGALALAYALGSTVVCVAAAALGIALSRSLMG